MSAAHAQTAPIAIKPAVRWHDLPDAERRTLIAGMVAEGMTAGDISASLGLTRNALGGWCHRAGIRLTNRVVRLALPATQAAPPTDVWEPKWPVVGILELTDKSCRWPVGDPALRLFCGCRIKRGSYCAEHAAIAFAPVQGAEIHPVKEHSRFAPFVTKEEARALAGVRILEGAE